MSDKTNKPNHHTDATMSQTETQSGPLDVFPIGLGCTGMTPHSYPDSPRREEMIQVLRTAAELGVEFFDTSEIKGHTPARSCLATPSPALNPSLRARRAPRGLRQRRRAILRATLRNGPRRLPPSLVGISTTANPPAS
ncbi:hypothetical protein [Corynebacterium propinquum]